jgi:hypothetical protein
MSVSTQAAPRQISFGRFPAAMAVIALALVIAAAVAIVALNGTKAAAPATTGAKGAPPPAVIDHGWSSAVDYGQSVTNVPFYDHGWSGINEPGQSVTGAPFNDHGWSQAGTSAAPAPYTGPYYNNGVFAVPPVAASGAATTTSGADPYLGPAYKGMVAAPASTTTTSGADPYLGPLYYSSTAGYPPFGLSGATRTIDSPHVAPGLRKQ